MNRRQFSARMLASGLVGASPECFAQVKPFVIRVVRTGGWEQLMQQEMCIPGTVYNVDPDRIQSDRPGNRVCYSMELPRRANQDRISAIPPGRLSCSCASERSQRTSHSAFWRAWA